MSGHVRRNTQYTFDDDSVNLQNGTRATRTAAGKDSIFTPVLSDAERSAFALTAPNRIAFKHAHSQQNPEKDWGTLTLRSVEFAYYVLNEQYAHLQVIAFVTWCASLPVTPSRLPQAFLTAPPPLCSRPSRIPKD